MTEVDLVSIETHLSCLQIDLKREISICHVVLICMFSLISSCIIQSVFHEKEREKEIKSKSECLKCRDKKLQLVHVW